jgi:hypothetical protein
MTPEQLAEAEVAIEKAREQHPNLGWRGLYPFAVNRVGLRHLNKATDMPDAAQVATAIGFLRSCSPAVSRGQNSYALKHQAEDWGFRNGMEHYVSNGALIAAAIYLGFTVKRSSAVNSPNAVVGVDRQSQDVCGCAAWRRRWA